VSGAKAPALRSRYSDDDAFGCSTHGTRKGAQIEAGLILLKKREDHRRVAVRAKRALIGSFAVEKRGNRTIEHKRFPWLGGSATLSVTDRCRGRGGDGINMRFGLRSFRSKLLTSKKLKTLFRPKPFSGLQDFSTI
jgi:hypothetical protein